METFENPVAVRLLGRNVAARRLGSDLSLDGFLIAQDGEEIVAAAELNTGAGHFSGVTN